MTSWGLETALNFLIYFCKKSIIQGYFIASAAT